MRKSSASNREGSPRAVGKKMLEKEIEYLLEQLDRKQQIMMGIQRNYQALALACREKTDEAETFSNKFNNQEQMIQKLKGSFIFLFVCLFLYKNYLKN